MFRKSSHTTKNSIDMVNGPIFSTLIKFSIPIVLSNIMSWCFNAADMMVVGKFVNDDAFAAVSAAAAPSFILTGAISSIALGANICNARAFGSKDHDRIKQSVHTSMAFSLVAGFIVSLIGILFSTPMLTVMNVPDSIIASSALYLRVYYLGTFAGTVYNYASSILRTKGDVKSPTVYILIAGVVNVILNLIFVIVFHLGVAGVALATLLSNVLSAVLSVRKLMLADDSSRLMIRELRFDPSILKDIIKIGVPAGLRMFVFYAATFFTDSAMNSFNNAAIISGHGAGGSVESLIRYIPAAIYSATVVMVGQNYGAKNYARIVKAQRCGLISITVTGITLGLGAVLFADKLLLAYISSSEAIGYGTMRFMFITVFCCCDIMADTFCGSMQSFEHPVLPMVTSFFAICVFRVVWVLTVFRISPSYPMLLACYPLSNILSMTSLGILNIILLRKVKKKFSAEKELSKV